MAYTDIDKSDDYFNTKLYSGTNTPQSITGVGFQPDWTWIKVRNVADNHYIYDSVRGATKFVHSDLGSAEGTLANGLTSFNSDGFSLGDSGSTNNASNTFASWNWLASNTTASNTDGSITSTVSANTTSGFSIVSWTGTGATATVGHGLGAEPSLFILKDRDDAYDWRVYVKSLGNTGAMILNSTTAFVTDSSYYNNTTPSSTVFTLGNNAGNNGSGRDYVAYCFAEKKGFSKFGKFTGISGNEFIYTGFKPAFVIIKRTDASSDWYMFDNKRNPFNLSKKALDANSSDAEATYVAGLDFLSNGFVERSFLADAGRELIYMAFAENPFVTSTGVPATAR